MQARVIPNDCDVEIPVPSDVRSLVPKSFNVQIIQTEVGKLLCISRGYSVKNTEGMMHVDVPFDGNLTRDGAQVLTRHLMRAVSHKKQELVSRR